LDACRNLRINRFRAAPVVWRVGSEAGCWGESEGQLEVAQRQTRQLQAVNEGLKLEIRVLAKALNLPSTFDDLFRELVLTESTVTDLQRQLAALHEKARVVHNLQDALGHELQSRNSANTELDMLAKQAAETAKANQTLRNAGLVKTGESLSETVKRLSDDARETQAVVEEAGLTPENLKQFAAREHQTAHSLDDCRGSLANMQQRFVAIGHGTERPACWADPQTGHPEYIFNIALTSTGLILCDNALQGRTEDERKLPRREIKFGPELPPEEFLKETLAIYEYRNNQKAPNVGCRFFVKVFDETKPYEKDIYKRHLRTVGSRFYYYEAREAEFYCPNESASVGSP
jgi:hypothetical protein